MQSSGNLLLFNHNPNKTKELIWPPDDFSEGLMKDQGNLLKYSHPDCLDISGKVKRSFLRLRKFSRSLSLLKNSTGSEIL